MRALAWFLMAIAGTLVVAALLGYPAFQLTQWLNPDWAFHKVISRLWQLLMIVGIALCIWRLGLRDKHDWGYGLARPVFLRQFGLALALGVATMLPMTWVILALGLREPRLEWDLMLLAQGIASGFIAGLAVALIEETFFRGLMYRAIVRERGLLLAAVSTSLLYAAVHFLARSRIASEDVHWGSGLDLLGGAFARFADPATMIDSFTALALVGLLLALVRHWTGAIAAGMGLHMGWVWVIKATTVTTVGSGATSEWSGLVSRFDGFTGWLVAGWCALILLVLLATRRHWLRWRDPAISPRRDG